jgi:uncharacterized DUF497 family protein
VYYLVGVVMAIEESMEYNGFDPSYADQWEDYADKLNQGFIRGEVPEDLQGDAISENGQCEWDKVKAFVNKWTHNITFEEVSKLFGVSLPGYKIMGEVPNAYGTGRSSPSGVDWRDFVLAEIGKGRYAVIKVDRGNTSSGRIRLISAFPLKPSEFEKVLKRFLSSSISQEEFVLSAFRCMKPFGVTGLVVRNSLLAGRTSEEDAVRRLMRDFDYPAKDAEVVVSGWKLNYFKD